MKNILLSISVLFLCNGTLAANKSFTLALNNYPLNGYSCASAATTIARQLMASAPWVKEAIGVCASAIGGQIEIRYIAEAERKPFTSDPWPVYSSYSSCMSYLPTEEALFTQLTTLKPLIRFCALQSYVFGNDRNFALYSPIFMSEGTPERVNKSVELQMYDGLFLGTKEVADEIVRKSQSIGIPVTSAFFDGLGNASMTKLWLRLTLSPAQLTLDPSYLFLLKNKIEGYYSPSTSLFEKALDPMRGESPAQCEVRRQEAVTLFSNAFSSPVVWFCMWDTVSFRSTLYHLRIRPGEESFEQVIPGKDGEPFLNEYSSKAQCESDKARVLQFYRGKFPDRFVGAMCSWPSQRDPSMTVKVFVYVTAE